MGGLYEGCIDNTQRIYECGSENFYKKLDEVKDLVLKNGNKVVFVEGGSSFISSARVVIYKDKVPQMMQDYKYRIVKIGDKWYRNGLLGYCDCCGEYTEIICLCEKGDICKKCL